MMRESKVEARFVKVCAEHGLLAEKWQGQGGNEDRLVFGWNGVLGLAEIKRPGGHVKARQKEAHEEHRRRGFFVMVVDDDEDIARFVATMVARSGKV